ncbi:MAG: lysophospholipid acyltransferase family protein [Pseudomonadota bacterium]
MPEGSGHRGRTKRRLKLFRTKREPRFPELSYAADGDPRLKRWVIHTVEGLSGRDRYLDLYETWRARFVGKSDTIMGDLLRLLNVRITRHAKQWPPNDIPDGPLVIVANHPFGVGDGMASLALAEELGRPFRVIINKELMKIPEIRPYSLPVDFNETREAVQTNLQTKKEALRLLAEGVTIVVFPAGGVATAKKAFGKAQDLPWKLFPARLIQSARATVLPVYFAGQNGPIFHIVSKFSMTLRLSLLIREFKRFTKSAVHIYIGDFIPYEDLAHIKDRQKLTDALHDSVHDLAPERPPHRRRLSA